MIARVFLAVSRGVRTLMRLILVIALIWGRWGGTGLSESRFTGPVSSTG